MKPLQKLTGWVVTIVSGLAVAGSMPDHFAISSNGGQQTVISSTTRVVVVVIPGFPIESVVLGLLFGSMLLVIARKRIHANNKRV